MKVNFLLSDIIKKHCFRRKILTYTNICTEKVSFGKSAEFVSKSGIREYFRSCTRKEIWWLNVLRFVRKSTILDSWYNLQSTSLFSNLQRHALVIRQVEPLTLCYTFQDHVLFHLFSFLARTVLFIKCALFYFALKYFTSPGWFLHTAVFSVNIRDTSPLRFLYFLLYYVWFFRCFSVAADTESSATLSVLILRNYAPWLEIHSRMST